ncbi:acyl carrier protein [Streptomyces sp. NBRC 109706]|uniref:acyl carrier protein n=1 Tax=Streptomyces sp. NBRC 109706 TaxID=1550035 RepID=UPI000780CBB6|nr:acyl carrier protein [Streptomyces sp. NBRC 109706]
MTSEPISREQVAAVTTELVAAELEISPSEIALTDVLKGLPGADSMKLLRVVSKLERHWDAEFDDEAIFAARTVDDLITLVQKHLGEETAGS